MTDTTDIAILDDLQARTLELAADFRAAAAKCASETARLQIQMLAIQLDQMTQIIGFQSNTLLDQIAPQLEGK